MGFGGWVTVRGDAANNDAPGGESAGWLSVWGRGRGEERKWVARRKEEEKGTGRTMRAS